MSILLARMSLASNFIRINPIEQCEHIHIWNVIHIIIKRAMNSKKNWNHSGKYLLAMVFASVLLSTFGIFTYNAFAENISIRAGSQKVPDNHLGNTISSAQTNTNVKHVDDKTNTNHSVKHIKSPPHLPPSIIEQYMQSKHIKSPPHLPPSMIEQCMQSKHCK